MATANPIPFPNPAPLPDHPAKRDAPEERSSQQAASAPRKPEAGSPKAFSKWQQDVLELLAFGSSVAAAMRAVHLAESTFYKTCERHPAFHEAVDRARAYYRVQVEDAFHEADAYARVLVDRIQRDENLKPHLRLRAALAILNRKPGKWLPHAIPSPAHVPEFSLDETIEPSPAPEDHASPNQFQDPENQPSEARAPQPPPAQNAPGGLETLDTLDTAANAEDIEELLEDQALIEEPDELYSSLFPAQTLDTLDNADPGSTPEDLRPVLGRERIAETTIPPGHSSKQSSAVSAEGSAA